jgi:oligosaccharyltransferase complex subunit gamma
LSVRLFTRERNGTRFNFNIYSEFDPEYTLVAKTFQKSKDNKKLFFGHLDFKDGQAVYQKVSKVEVFTMK